ncbi:XRE family transcriptional regulator [Geobacillus sp. NFOSA3]|uniref:helix-turn-helix domain-containing protein n=1 Tax=Parageobacillus thermoglucosidasius TaxID=1426 RepID=UPI0001D18748|nr:helix-turn-helix transcriptional regulator [Parageobacillus thermoglucosidasius]AEH49825.1 transcriptional regulator, XRE family [Parageobacillus thermoglucosidasius C56-YS93]MBY6273442.1 XRE family transcriptional regulator [Bacillaceae bacterium]NNU94694.1 XRE family transcriptional regulator [Geobacillus sp. NFOSA3]
MISYKPLLKLLIDRGIKKQDLQKAANISWSTMAKFNKGEYVSLEVIDRICAVLDCQPGDLIEYIPDEKES